MILQVKSDSSVLENSNRTADRGWHSLCIINPPSLKMWYMWIFFCGWDQVGYTPSMSQTQLFLVYKGIWTCMDQKDASFCFMSERRYSSNLKAQILAWITHDVPVSCESITHRRGKQNILRKNIYLSLCVSVFAFNPVLFNLHRHVEPQRKWSAPL